MSFTVIYNKQTYEVLITPVESRCFGLIILGQMSKVFVYRWCVNMKKNYRIWLPKHSSPKSLKVKNAVGKKCSKRLIDEPWLTVKLWKRQCYINKKWKKKWWRCFNWKTIKNDERESHLSSKRQWRNSKEASIVMRKLSLGSLYVRSVF